MDNSLYLVAASMDVAAREQSRIAHNLANIQTTGFKEVLSHVEGKAGNEEGEEDGSIPFPYVEEYQSFSQGTLKNTANAMDIAIEGGGFLVLEGSGGETRYFRSGHLHVNEQGLLQDSHGFHVIGDSGAIAIPAGRENDIFISGDGRIELDGEEIATLKIAKFSAPERLVSYEGTYIAPRDLSPTIDQQSKIRQGFIEQSTTDSTQAMTNVIANMRYLETMQRVTRTLDESWQQLMDR